MANIHDVARRAGVSVATVSHVINESRFVSAPTRKKVLAAVAELNYRRDGIARSLRRAKTGTIGVLISDITNPFFSDLVRGIEDAIYDRKDGHNFILCNTEEDDAKELLYLNVLLEKRVDGMIIAPAGGNEAELKAIIASGVPMVFVDRAIIGVDADSVGVNNREAAGEAVAHMIRLGHRSIAVMRAQLRADTIEDRVAGYRDALAGAGLLIVPALSPVSASTIAAAQQVGRDLLASAGRPDAIFCTNNFMTLGLMQAVTEAGLECPRDIAVVGFDDFPWSTAFRPRLTAVAQPSYQIGVEAVALLFDRILGRRQGVPVRLTLKASLIVRDSCGDKRRPTAV
jgi:LacI family transcriptional regulator, galactose operon repressor